MDPDLLAMLAPMAVNGVGGALSSLFNNSKPGQVGYNVVNTNDPQDYGYRAQSQAFMSDALKGIQNGQGPSWMNNTLDPMTQFLLQQSKNQMYGMPGMSGGSIADVSQSQGADMGISGAAAMAPLNTALADYGQRMNGINQYINSLKYNTMNQEANAFPQQLYQTAQPRNQVVPMNYPGTANTAPNLSTLGQGINWGNVFGGGNQTQPDANSMGAMYSSMMMPQNNTNLNNGMYGAMTGSVPGINYVPQQAPSYQQ